MPAAFGTRFPVAASAGACRVVKERATLRRLGHARANRSGCARRKPPRAANMCTRPLVLHPFVLPSDARQHPLASRSSPPRACRRNGREPSCAGGGPPGSLFVIIPLAVQPGRRMVLRPRQWPGHCACAYPHVPATPALRCISLVAARGVVDIPTRRPRSAPPPGPRARACATGWHDYGYETDSCWVAELHGEVWLGGPDPYAIQAEQRRRRKACRSTPGSSAAPRRVSFRYEPSGRRSTACRSSSSRTSSNASSKARAPRLLRECARAFRRASRRKVALNG